jgi:hypothetical protein
MISRRRIKQIMVMTPTASRAIKEVSFLRPYFVKYR